MACTLGYLYEWLIPLGWLVTAAPQKCPVVLAKALDKQSKWAEGMSEKKRRDIETSKGATSGPRLIHNSWHRRWPLGLLTWSTQPLTRGGQVTFLDHGASRGLGKAMAF